MTMRQTIAEQQALIDRYRERLAVKDGAIAAQRLQLAYMRAQLDGYRKTCGVIEVLGWSGSEMHIDIALPPVAD